MLTRVLGLHLDRSTVYLDCASVRLGLGQVRPRGVGIGSGPRGMLRGALVC